MTVLVWPDDTIGLAYCELAAAIVRRAAEDYEEALTCILRAETRAVRKHAIDSKREVERFFLGEWFPALSELDPMAVIEELEKRVLKNETEEAFRELRTAMEEYEVKKGR